MATKLLLKKNAMIEARGMDGNTALNMASWNGKASVVKLLLKNKAKIEARDNMQYTSLTKAASKGHTDVARTLLNRGADPETKCDLRMYLIGRRMKAIDLAAGVMPAKIKRLLKVSAELKRGTRRILSEGATLWVDLNCI